MSEKYVIGIDQSTQGTKIVLFDNLGEIKKRVYRSHTQLVDKNGYVSHDMEEVYANVIQGVSELLENMEIDLKDIVSVGITNQRETTLAWNPSGTPYAPAIVWQCHRATEVAERHKKQADYIQERTGLPLSPFFPASKIQWLMENELQNIPRDEIYFGTVDSFLVYRLTNGTCYATDYSNASRTQLFDLHTLSWNEEIVKSFGIEISMLPKVYDSNASYGTTNFAGILPNRIPICSVMGDSHAALYGQGCHESGMMKATYGTGSSIMLHTGNIPQMGKHGLAVSLAWGIDGIVSYVLEGNVNYAGAVISWLKNDMGLISSVDEVEPLAFVANKKDTTVLVPAFTGLSAPYWNNYARAAIVGMTRTTGKAEIVKAAVESIAEQIADVIEVMEQVCETKITELLVDGGPTKNMYLMQFQCDILAGRMRISNTEELSVIGAAYLAGITKGCMDKEVVFSKISYQELQSSMSAKEREVNRRKWKEAVQIICSDAGKEESEC